MGVSLQFVGISLFDSKGQEAQNTVYASFITAKLDVTLSNEHQAYKWTPLPDALQMSLAGRLAGFSVQ